MMLHRYLPSQFSALSRPAIHRGVHTVNRCAKGRVLASCISKTRQVSLLQHIAESSRLLDRKKHRRLQHNVTSDSSSIKTLPEISSTIPHMGQGVKVGQIATTERTYSIEDVKDFAACVQDYNPLHTVMDWETAVQDNPFWKIHEQNELIRFDENEEGTITTQPIVHGMLVSSIFSSIFAKLSPGCIYMNQSLSFENPVYANDTVQGRIEIERIRKWRKGGVVVQCMTEAVILPIDVGSNDDGNVARSNQVKHAANPTELVAIKGTANVWLPSGCKD